MRDLRMNGKGQALVLYRVTLFADGVERVLFAVGKANDEVSKAFDRFYPGCVTKVESLRSVTLILSAIE